MTEKGKHNKIWYRLKVSVGEIMGWHSKIGKLNYPTIFVVRYATMLVVCVFSIYIIGSNIVGTIPESQVPYIIMIFFALISLFLVILTISQDENHNKILNLIDNRKKHVPFTNHIMGSDFEFKKMVCDADENIFLIGPNLYFLADVENNQEIKKLLFQKLKNNPNFEIKLLLSDPSNKEICKIMSQISFTPTFQTELDIAITEFTNWKKEADSKGYTNLKIRKSGVITISLLFIDEINEKKAHLLVTPVPWKISGKYRPAFLIKREQHESAYDKYHERYSELFKAAEDIL